MSETLLRGRYRLIAQQGSGGMAVIYRAIDQELGRTVAVKILRPSLTGDEEFLKRFKNEARNVANLSHPNIVTVHDVGNDGQTHFIVMEFIDGSDLKKLIRRDGALPVDVAVDLAIQICAGIGFAHRAGLVHADVKPQNVLLTSSRQVKVTDFGIAQAFSYTQPQQKEQIVWGSPHYFAPEQAEGEKPTPASDVYSIGIVMFEMLSGHLPYAGASQQELAMAHIKEPVPHLSEVAPHVPEALSRIVYKVMSKKPEQRYRMADQLGQILVNYRDRGQQSTTVNPRMIPGQPGQPQPPQNQALPPDPGQRFQRPDQQEQRPLYYEPVQAASDERTQKYSMAPEAPGGSAAQQQPQSEYVPTPSPVQQPQAMGYMTPDSGGYSRPVTGASRPVGRFDQEASGLDAITIILAVLALISVACLLPLYYLVYLAYFPGS